MKRIIGILCLLLVWNVSLAQPEKAEVTWKDGAKYYVHMVQAGNTLYGLTKLYGVSAEEIIAANPELSAGVKDGQRLLIPAVTTATVKTPTPTPAVDKNAKKHIVEKSETLYGISRKYNVTMEEMVKSNPGTENGISVGQELIIPDKGTVSEVQKPKTENKTAVNTENKVTFYDTTIVHTVLSHETIYSISKRFMVSVEEIQQVNGLKNTRIKSGDVIKIPLKKEKISKVEIRQVEKTPAKKVDEELIFKSKNDYKVLLLLPFSLDKGKDGLTGIATEFLMGAQIALDSLEQLGFNADVQVIDVGVDTTKLKSMFSQKEFKSVDLVIGPFMGDHLEIVARWCKSNKVRMVSPIAAQTNVLKDNVFVSNAVTSDITLMQGTAAHIAKEFSREQIVLVKTGTKDADLYQAFRQKFMALSASGSKQKLVEIELLDVGTHIRKGGNTIFVVPTRDKITAVKFMNALHKVAGKSGTGTITVFGTKEWVNFDDVKSFYKNKYNFHYASSNDFNYKYESTKNLQRNYRKAYNADLGKYGTQGFDVVFYFVQSMLMEAKPEAGVMNNIRMASTGAGNGTENKACFILKQQDYEIVKVTEVND